MRGTVLRKPSFLFHDSGVLNLLYAFRGTGGAFIHLSIHYPIPKTCSNYFFDPKQLKGRERPGLKRETAL